MTTETGKAREELTLVPAYEECESSSFGTAEVVENHCAYALGSDTATHGGALQHAAVDLECAEGSAIEIELPEAGITVKVGPQEALYGLRYAGVEDEETGRAAITADATVEEIAWSCAPAFLCTLGLGVTGGTDATYEGATLIRGFEA